MFSTALPQPTEHSSLALRAKLSFIVVAVMAAVMLPFGWFIVRDLERAATEEAVAQLSASNLMLHNMIAANQDGLKIALLRLGTVFHQYYQGTFSIDPTRSVKAGGVSAPVLKLNGKPLSLDHGIVNQFSHDTGGSVATVFVRVGDDFLRITTSLTREDGTPAIGTFLAVAQHLHLQVVAEGVETEAQAEFLKARGKVIYQGYLYGRPEPVEAWLARLHAVREPA